MSDIATDGISLIWPKRPGKEIFPFMPVAAEHVEIHVSLYAIDLSVMVILPECPLGIYRSLGKRAYPKGRARKALCQIVEISVPIGIERNPVSHEIQIIYHLREPVSDRIRRDAFRVSMPVSYTHLTLPTIEP